MVNHSSETQQQQQQFTKGHASCIYRTRMEAVAKRPSSLVASLVVSRPLVVIFLLLVSLSAASGLRCYVCGGSTGRECEEIYTRRWSPYVRPRPVLSADGKKQWEECNDLINNKGCIKQVVNGVVLLRACWMQGAEKCMQDGDATVCTCSEDLCNSSTRRTPSWMLLLVILTSTVFSLNRLIVT